MCGVIGYLGHKPCKDMIFQGLKKLEYRGYDSAGMALFQKDRIHVVKAQGKLIHLEAFLGDLPADATAGMGHTRWATHGAPSQANAHPHANRDIAIIHNGIFENYQDLKRGFIEQGTKFASQTDSEVLLPFLESRLTYHRGDTLAALQDILKTFRGAYAIGIMFREDPDHMYLVKQGAPLAMGVGKDEMFFASDALALQEYTSQAVFLEDGDIARLSVHGYKVWDRHGVAQTRLPVTLEWGSYTQDKDGFRHYMLKEIHEQPKVIRQLLDRVWEPRSQTLQFDSLNLNTLDMDKVTSVYILGCGTAYLAGLVGKTLLEAQVRIPVHVELASEFRYGSPCLDAHCLIIAMTQSGETADTLASVKLAKQMGAQVYTICNVRHASIPRESHGTLYMEAGSEIGVASTKAFTAMVAHLYLFTLAWASQRNQITPAALQQAATQLQQLPQAMDQMISQKHAIEDIARSYYSATNALFIGRGCSHPIAFEGALKLKEISYIHAEGYAGGELKHGPIALVDPSMPIVAIVPKDRHHEKMLSNVEEVYARAGKIIGVGGEHDEALQRLCQHYIPCPQIDNEALQAILSVIPLQFFSYYVAVLKGTDVDQPRNLAKSVTVE